METENNVVIEEEEKEYMPSIDILRVVCMALIILLEFGMYVIPYFAYAQPFFNVAAGTLFTLYGFLVLRDGADLKKNIKHALKVFTIMFAIYGLLTAVYYWLTTGSFFSGISKRGVFNFVVLNYWGTNFCASLWYVQSILYSLIIFWIFRKFKKYDWLVCIILFVISALLGEFAGLINFSFLGYTYIPGNFFNRTMPYMLLGRIIYEHYEDLTFRLRFGPMVYVFLGLLLSVGEFLALGFTGNLVYSNHFLGFIPMAAFLCINCVCSPYGGALGIIGDYASTIYKGMYYTYNPLGYILLILAGIFCQTQEQYNTCVYVSGIVVLVITFGIFFLVAYLRQKEEYRRQAFRWEEDFDDET